MVTFPPGPAKAPAIPAAICSVACVGKLDTPAPQLPSKHLFGRYFITSLHSMFIPFNF